MWVCLPPTEVASLAVGKKNKKKCLTSLGRCAGGSRLQQYPWNEIFHKIGPTHCIPVTIGRNFFKL